MTGLHVLSPHYELLSVVGRGGHSIVYRARELRTNEDVAIKMLYTASARDPELVLRMKREWQAMKELAGTAAVRVFDLFTAPNGSLCIVMELLVGRDLDDFLTEFESWGAPLPSETLFDLLEPVARTLELAHAKGIVHRDLKPANVYVLDAARGGGVRLIDFGLAKLMHSAAVTRDGFVVGSPSYMAPEIWSGKPQKLDHRIDVYSLGSLVFRALTGRVPFEAESIVDKMRLATSAKRPSLHALRPDLPKAIDGWVERALAVDPDERFGDVSSMWRDLREILA